MIGLLLAAQLSVVAHVPDSAPTCAPVDITVAARAAGSAAPRLSIVGNPAVQVLKSRTAVSTDKGAGGAVSSLTEATFTVAFAGTGRIAAPQFVATHGTERASSSAATIDVQATTTSTPSVVVRAWVDRDGTEIPADSAFVGQQVDYVVDVHLNEAARERLRRNPTFFPPEMPGVLAYDLAAPAALTRAGRRCFETLSYRRALFPLFAGRAAIAPAALTYSLPVSTSFFSREESFELRTDSVHFTVLDVPRDGRPAQFAGAVGTLAATSRLSTVSARMGDPVVLTLRIEGAGNVKLWPRPPLSVEWASVAEGGERVVVDTSQARVRGAKEFDWLLTPRKAGALQVAPIEYSYFDPGKQAYATTTTQALGLTIANAALASVDTAPQTRLGIRRTMGPDRTSSSAERPWFWMLLAVAPLPAAVRKARGKARRRVDRRSALRRLRHAAEKEEHAGAREVRRLYFSAVAERVPATSGLTSPRAFESALRRAGVTDDTASRAARLMEQLDDAAFSPAGSIERSLLLDATELAGTIDREAVATILPKGAAVMLPIIALAFVVGAAAALQDDLAATFHQGVEAYDHGAWSTSQRAFVHVVVRAPRSVDAWANLGTANWARLDTAEAMRGWQRALRLDPLDNDVRDRIDAVQPAAIQAPGFVPPVSLDWIAWPAFLLWSGSWLALAVPLQRRPAVTRPIAGAAIVVAVVLFAASFELRERTAPGGLAVLRNTRPLLEAPESQLASASGFAGETGRLGAREGVWVHIALDGSRQGWIPAASVLALDAPPTD